MKTIYTIGHSIHPINFFLKLLFENKIDCVVDVRSVPYSKYASQYNAKELKQLLQNNGIHYVFMGKEFGARQSDRTFYHKDGYLDFNKVIQSALFKKGIERISEGLNKGLSIVFMCKEKDPIDCHRNFMVARAFYDLKYNIVHIHENGELETQDQVNERLLELYFPDRAQKTILDLLEGDMSRHEMLREAFRLRNKDIAYKGENKVERS